MKHHCCLGFILQHKAIHELCYHSFLNDTVLFPKPKKALPLVV